MREVREKMETNRTLALRIRKTQDSIHGAHNEKRGIRKLNTHWKY